MMTPEESTMVKDIKEILSRSGESMLGEALAVLSLFGMLFVGLSLPGPF
jgi:hypothetical protein